MKQKTFRVKVIEVMLFLLLAVVFAVMIVGCTALMVALYRYILL